MSKPIEEKLQIINVTFFHQFAHVFHLTSLQTTTLRYIERCFTTVVDTQQFLEIDFTLISKILGSCELSVTTELEVLSAANKWLSHNLKERSKFAKQLFLKVRLPLLSDHTLQNLMNIYSLFSQSEDCKALLKKVVKNKSKLCVNSSRVYHTARYCNQELFKILFFGGVESRYRIFRNVNQSNEIDIKCAKIHPPVADNRRFSEAVCLRGEVFVFGGYGGDNNWIRSVDKYSPVNHGWTKVADIRDNRQFYHACAFMNKVFIVGGCIGSTSNRIVISTCLQFDAKDYSLKEVASMSEARQDAACAAFEDNVIICGGYGNDFRSSNTVESYDAVAGDWTRMPNMNERRSNHSLVVVKTKMYVIGGFNAAKCEVFDNKSKLFVSLNSPFAISANQALSIGSKIFVFQDDTPSVFVYDVQNDQWSEKSCEAAKNFRWYSSVKLPIY